MMNWEVSERNDSCIIEVLSWHVPEGKLLIQIYKKIYTPDVTLGLYVQKTAELKEKGCWA
jgi:hypothetical protein